MRIETVFLPRLQTLLSIATLAVAAFTAAPASANVSGEFCGGIAGITCDDGTLCVDDTSDDCDPDNGGADCPGVCLGFCGGFAGFPCADGYECVDIPDDGCDPASGGADCPGQCEPEGPALSCEGNCGYIVDGYNGDWCLCDPLCEIWDICCDDFYEVCE